MDQQELERKNNLFVELQKLELFAELSRQQLSKIVSIATTKTCSRGEFLIRQGEMDNCFFVVLSGSFEIKLEEQEIKLANIGVGQPIGEVGFIAGLPRTANVIAMRESIVLVLEKESFEEVCKDNPEIWRSLAVALARRLLVTNLGGSTRRKQVPNTITLIPAGPGQLDRDIVRQFIEGFPSKSNVLLLDSENVDKYVRDQQTRGRNQLTRALNSLEMQYDHIVYLCDSEMNEWSQLSIKQADLVLAIGVHDNKIASEVPLNNHERYASNLHSANCRRLVLIHPKRYVIQGTRHWLAQREVKLHHHLVRGDDTDFQRLARFVRGEAIGFVACGGGALCCAHIGIFKAISEFGLNFDIIGGTSGGAAMAAAFANNIPPDDIERQTHDMFVTRKALKRYNIPVYSLLDHRYFDLELQRVYGRGRVEDFWIPYYALAADLTNGRSKVIREGPIWQAIRASSALPALLPPFYTNKGEMLADGALVDNVPIKAMHNLKDGPNIVVSFEENRFEEYPVEYESIPSRFGLLRMAMGKAGRSMLKKTPFLDDALIRALLANRRDFRAHLGERDILLIPDLPEEISFMGWQHSKYLMSSSYRWMRNELMENKKTYDNLASLSVEPGFSGWF